MGRLRFGETLISERLRNGMSVYPPLPPRTTFGVKRTAKSAPPTVVVDEDESDLLTESDAPSPVDEDESDLLLSKSNAPPPVDEDESDLLSKLCDFPDTKFRKSELSSRKRKRCASAAVALRKALISELMSLDNVQLMVCKANDAFASLSSYHADFGDLYEAVRAFISYHCQLSEANKELESNGCLQEDMAVHQDNLLAWLNQEAEALSGTTTSIAKARKNAAVLMTRIGKTRKLLKELEEKLAQKDMEIDDLEKEGHKLEESYEATKAEQQNIAEQIEKEEKNAQQIKFRCDKARAGIEQTKALLSSLC